MTSSLNLFLSLFSLKCASKYCTRCFFVLPIWQNTSNRGGGSSRGGQVFVMDSSHRLSCKSTLTKEFDILRDSCVLVLVCVLGVGVSHKRESSEKPVWREPRKRSEYRRTSAPHPTPPLPSALVLIAFHTFSPSLLGSGVVFLHLHSSFKHQGCP